MIEYYRNIVAQREIYLLTPVATGNPVGLVTATGVFCCDPVGLVTATGVFCCDPVGLVTTTGVVENIRFVPKLKAE
jgi:hypothetical protein